MTSRGSGIAELVMEIRAGRLSCADGVRASHERIRELNGELGAIVSLAADAGSRARELDSSGGFGPLAGATFSVKDSIAVAGLPATAGSLALEHWVPAWTAPAIDRLREAGAILIGKGNCPEFAYDLHTANALHGTTGNPLDPRVTIGGSSGGDAAAVASGMVDFGIGTDLGGSIRWPAACAGTVAIRPTPGLVPGAGQHPLSDDERPEPRSTLSFRSRSQVIAPLARGVDDAWRVLRVLAGPHPLDPNCVPAPLRDPGEVELGSLAVGWMSGRELWPLRADLSEVLTGLRGRLGARVRGIEPVDGSWAVRAVDCFARLRGAEGQDDLIRAVAGREELLGERIAGAIAAARARPASASEYLEAAALQARIQAEVLELLDRVPVIVAPLAPVTAFDPGLRTLDFDGFSMPADRVLDLCRALTLVGVPVISVPFGEGADGLPVSVQVFARPFHEHEAAAVAAEIERLAHDRGGD